MAPSNPLTVAVGLLATGVFAAGSYVAVHPHGTRPAFAAGSPYRSLTPSPSKPRPVRSPTSLALAALTVSSSASYSRTSAATPSV